MEIIRVIRPYVELRSDEITDSNENIYKKPLAHELIPKLLFIHLLHFTHTQR